MHSRFFVVVVNNFVSPHRCFSSLCFVHFHVFFFWVGSSKSHLSGIMWLIQKQLCKSFRWKIEFRLLLSTLVPNKKQQKKTVPWRFCAKQIAMKQETNAKWMIEDRCLVRMNKTGEECKVRKWHPYFSSVSLSHAAATNSYQTFKSKL